MKSLLSLVFLLSLAGCGSALSDLTVAANFGNDAIVDAGSAIDRVCLPLYAAAKAKPATEVKAAVDAADRLCLEPQRTYAVALAAWQVERDVILAAQKSGDASALKTAGPALAKAVAELLAATATLTTSVSK